MTTMEKALSATLVLVLQHAEKLESENGAMHVMNMSLVKECESLHREVDELRRRAADAATPKAKR
jgi:hypothetical protein